MMHKPSYSVSSDGCERLIDCCRHLALCAKLEALVDPDDAERVSTRVSRVSRDPDRHVETATTRVWNWKYGIRINGTGIKG